MNLHPVDIQTQAPVIFQCFQKRTPLLTAGDDRVCNTMTIGWGQLGTLWNLPVCTVYVRPERYTYQFMEAQDYFTVSFLPEDRRDALRLCGSKSGRDLDKIGACGLTVCRGAGNAPFFGEAELVLVCKKLFAQDLTPESVRDARVDRSYSPAMGGWHRMYTGEVVEVYAR